MTRMWQDRPFGQGLSEFERSQQCQAEHRGHWVVVQRKCNHSAFNGYHFTPSDYSAVQCNPATGGCGRVWRTKAAYVDKLPDKR